MPNDELDLPELVAKNTARTHDNAMGWKIATVIAMIALVYTILSNRQQNIDIVQFRDECRADLYQELTGHPAPTRVELHGKS